MIAYKRRSGRVDLSAVELAAYWGDLLDDFWSIAFRNRPPERLTTLHHGDALRLLYDLTEGTESDLGQAAQRMPSEVRHHLEELVHSVPRDFVFAGGDI